MKAEELEAEAKTTIDDIDQWGHVQGEVDVYIFDEEDLQQYKRAVIESQLQALKEEVLDLGFMEVEVMRRKQSEDGSFSGHRENTIVVEREEVLNLISNLEDK